MARQNITVNQITRAGIANVAGVAGTVDGIMFDNGGTTFLEVTTSAGSARTITFVTPGLVGDRQIEDLVVSVPAATTRKIGPFPTDTYNRPAGGTDPGKVYADFQAGQESGFTVSAYKT